MMKPASLIATAALAAGLMIQMPARAASAAQNPPVAWEQPSQMIQSVADQMLKALNGHRAEYRRDPSKVAQIVDEDLLPHFDTGLAARLVLGRFWRKATPDQRQRFIKAFHDSLIKNYGRALLGFHSNMLTVYPTHISRDKTVTTVRTEFHRSDGSPVSVNFYVHMTPAGWKAFDLVIDGISYVSAYHDDFAPQLEQQGLDVVIKRLEAGEKPNKIGREGGAS